MSRTTFYASSISGNDASDGLTEACPFKTIAQALSVLKRGDELVLLPGNYPPINITNPFPVAPDGVSTDKVTIRAMKPWTANINGRINSLIGPDLAPSHGIYVALAASPIIFKDLQISGAALQGMKIETSDNEIHHCWIHHNGANGLGAHFSDAHNV